MTFGRVKIFILLSLLVFGLAGGAGIVAAADSTLNPGYSTDPDFFSPAWAPEKYTYSFTDPDFFLSSWKPSATKYLYSDPGLLSSEWAIPVYKPTADVNFTYSNWSVKQPVIFRFSGIDSARISNYNLDPFATNDELRAQGFVIDDNYPFFF